MKLSLCNCPFKLSASDLLHCFAFVLSGERFFSRFKRIKNQLKGRNIPGEVVNIKHIKSDKLRQTNCDEFLDNFVIKKAGQNLFNCPLCYVQPCLIYDCSFLFLYTYFNNDSISEI